MRKFGVSGYLYNSDVLMWDDCGESFWSQVSATAVAGPETEKELTWLHVVDTTWASFKKDYPKGEVLKGPHPRIRYVRDMYQGYEKKDTPGFLDKSKADKRMHQKAVVTGVTIGDEAFCIPHKEIAKLESPVKVEFGGETLTLSYDEETDAVSVTKKTDDVDEDLTVMRAYWFAWAVFYPKTEVFEPTEEMPRKKAEKDSSKEEEDGFRPSRD